MIWIVQFFKEIKSIIVDIFLWIGETKYWKFFISIPGIHYIAQNPNLAFGVSGAVIENSLMIIGGGALCHTVGEVFFTILFAVICSIIVDISIFFILKKFVSHKIDKYEQQHPKISKILSSMGIYSMLVYRLLPFARFPALVICTRYNSSKVVLINAIGAFFTISFYLFLGFVFHK